MNYLQQTAGQHANTEHNVNNQAELSQKLKAMSNVFDKTLKELNKNYTELVKYTTPENATSLYMIDHLLNQNKDDSAILVGVKEKVKRQPHIIKDNQERQSMLQINKLSQQISNTASQPLVIKGPN